MTPVEDAVAEIFGNNAENGSTCGGNCPSASCATCKCGTSKLMVNIANECAAYSGWSQSCCQCIASHESGGNAHA